MPNKENDAPEAEVVVAEENEPGQAIVDGEDSTAPSDTATAAGPTESDSDQATGADEPAALRAKIDELSSENSELKNKYLRKQADFENYRKRMMRERDDAVAYANQQLLLDLTSIIDDFERAIRSADESRDYDAFHDGIALIEKQLTGMLERKWGLSRFDSEGEVFDPQKHEAVTGEERADQDTQVVLEDYQKGYMLHDRVLRSAKVKVSIPGANETENN